MASARPHLASTYMHETRATTGEYAFQWPLPAHISLRPEALFHGRRPPPRAFLLPPPCPLLCPHSTRRLSVSIASSLPHLASTPGCSCICLLPPRVSFNGLFSSTSRFDPPSLDCARSWGASPAFQWPLLGHISLR